MPLFQLTPEEEKRVERRRTQNRDAARRFRDKQKDRTIALEKVSTCMVANIITFRLLLFTKT